MSSDPVSTQFLRATNFAARTGRSHTSNVFTICCTGAEGEGREKIEEKKEAKTVAVAEEKVKKPKF